MVTQRLSLVSVVSLVRYIIARMQGLTSGLTVDDFDPKIGRKDYRMTHVCKCRSGCTLDCICRVESKHCSSECICWDSQLSCGNPYAQIVDLFTPRPPTLDLVFKASDCTESYAARTDQVDFGGLYDRLVGHPSAAEAFRLDDELEQLEELLRYNATANVNSTNYENAKRTLVRYAIGAHGNDDRPGKDEYGWSFCNDGWIAKDLMTHCTKCDTCVPRKIWHACDEEAISEEQRQRAEEVYGHGPSWERAPDFETVQDEDSDEEHGNHSGNLLYEARKMLTYCSAQMDRTVQTHSGTRPTSANVLEAAEKAVNATTMHLDVGEDAHASVCSTSVAIASLSCRHRYSPNLQMTSRRPSRASATNTCRGLLQEMGPPTALLPT